MLFDDDIVLMRLEGVNAKLELWMDYLESTRFKTIWTKTEYMEHKFSRNEGVIMIDNQEVPWS